MNSWQRDVENDQWVRQRPSSQGRRERSEPYAHAHATAMPPWPQEEVPATGTEPQTETQGINNTAAHNLTSLLRHVESQEGVHPVTTPPSQETLNPQSVGTSAPFMNDAPPRRCQYRQPPFIPRPGKGDGKGGNGDRDLRQDRHPA